jgi:trehalose 6-phosphate synthase
MRSTLRFTFLLALALGAVAWGASIAYNRQARAWAERDLAMRARLAVTAAESAFADASGVAASHLVDALVRDERLMGAAICTREGQTIAASAGFPEAGSCVSLPPVALQVTQAGWDTTLVTSSGALHVSAVGIGEPPARLVVLVHDMSFVERRAETTRRYTFAAFAMVGLLGAIAAALLARFSWLSWTSQLRRLLVAPFAEAVGATPRSPPRHLQPLLSDVRELVTTLASEQARSDTAWTPSRLRHVLRRDLGGEGIIVVANREP